MTKLVVKKSPSRDNGCKVNNNVVSYYRDLIKIGDVITFNELYQDLNMCLRHRKRKVRVLKKYPHLCQIESKTSKIETLTYAQIAMIKVYGRLV